MILDTLHQALITHTGVYICKSHGSLDGIDMQIAVYTYTVMDWGQPEQLKLIVW